MKVAYIGLGTMGSRMVMNLLKNGHEVVVNDVRKEAADPLIALGARWADSPALAASGAEGTFTSLPGPKEVEAVAMGESGVLHGIAEGAIYADLSTSSASLARSIYKAFEERGAHALDAPVSGGPFGAETATLIIMVGGDEAVFQRARPALESIGNNITYIGDAGAGGVAKLVHNMIGIASAQLTAEAFTLGVKAGVAPEKLLEAVRGGAYGKHMSLSQGLPQVVFTGDFDTPRFALARKDLGLATELARELGVPMAMAAVAEQGMIEAMTRGLGGKDSSAVWLLQEERAGVTVRTEE